MIRRQDLYQKKWLPVFANYRRDGYDFDALYDDGKAPNKHKKIMVNFMEDNADSEIYSNELKNKLDLVRMEKRDLMVL